MHTFFVLSSEQVCTVLFGIKILIYHQNPIKNPLQLSVKDNKFTIEFRERGFFLV